MATKKAIPQFPSELYVYDDDGILIANKTPQECVSSYYDVSSRTVAIYTLSEVVSVVSTVEVVRPKK